MLTLSASGSAYGNSKISAKPTISNSSTNTYLERIKPAIMHNWFAATGSQASATVLFRINKNGSVTWMELGDASNITAVNEAAEDAVLNAAPFPPLPQSLQYIDVSAKFASNIPHSALQRYSRPGSDRTKRAQQLLDQANRLFNSRLYLSAAEKLEEARTATPFSARVIDRLVQCYIAAADECKNDEENYPLMLHQALLLCPQNTEARTKLNEHWRKKGIAADSAESRLALARKYNSSGHPVDALSEYGEAWRIKPDPQLIAEINNTCKQRDAYYSVEKWKQTVNVSRSAENLAALAKAMENSGDFVGARSTFEEALKLDPSNEQARVSVATLAVQASPVVSSTAQPELTDEFPYKQDVNQHLSLSAVHNRQPNVDYFRWACMGQAVHRWTPGRFPLRLFVESGYAVPGWRPGFNKMVVDAFSAWQAASENRLSFVLANDRRGANVVCGWSAAPESMALDGAQGETLFEFQLAGKGNNTIRSAKIRILTVSRADGSALSDKMMRVVCLHEIGHALGIAGHSPYNSDVMFGALNQQYSPLVLTARDKATMKHLYQGYAHNPVSSK